MQYIEIVLLGLVAAFLVLRLRAVLGRRHGQENQAPDSFAPPVDQRTAEVPRPDARPGAAVLVAPRGPLVIAKSAEAGVARIKQADANFDPGAFVQGARAAFEMIVTAFAKGDTATLRPLLADDVYANFAAAIEQRRAQRHTLETQLIGFENVELAAAEMSGTQARVSLRFVSEQINVIRDADQLMVEGNPNEVEKITDLWTFARDTKSSDPTWLLVATDAQQ